MSSLLRAYDSPASKPIRNIRISTISAHGNVANNFLCFRYERLCEVLAEAIHFETIAAQAPVSGEAALWQIECECVHENCGALHAIYTKYLADASTADVIRILRNANPIIACMTEHSVELRDGKIIAKRLEVLMLACIVRCSMR